MSFSMQRERRSNMFEYEQQAIDFLHKCNATMKIEYLGCMENTLWNDNVKRNVYKATIITPKGKMNIRFWDSIHNTEISHMTKEDYAKKQFKCCYEYLTSIDKRKCIEELLKKKAEAKPTEYDILACLEKYEVGSMDDFIYEYGYEIKSAKDISNFISTYNAIVEEYNGLCRIFTAEQMEMLREIN